MVRAGHAACANAEREYAASGSTAAALRSSRRFIGSFLPGIFGWLLAA
jgi:hypothetical protein